MEIFTKYRNYTLIIFGFAFLLYANTIGHDFAWDDKIVIQENERVQEGISGIPNLFLKYSSDLRQDKYGYRPVTLSAFAIEYSLFGESPAGFHFMSVLWFSILCVVLFMVLRSIFESFNPLLPFIITMLFAAHPLHTEVVANIKSRDEIFALFFGLLAIYQFLKSYRNGHWKHLLLGTLFFILAFLSRENAVTFLAVIPLVLLIQGKIQWKRFLKSAALLPVLLMIAYLIFDYAQNSRLGQEQTAGFGVYQEHLLLGNSFYMSDHPGEITANACQLITRYIGKFLFPYPLTYYSGYNEIPVIKLNWVVVTGGILFVLLTIFGLLRFRKSPLFVFGSFFFLITLSVYLQVFQKLADTMADRFAFIPSIGLSIMLVSLLPLAFPILKEKQENIDLKLIPGSVRAGIGVVLLVLSVLTFSRNRVWADDFTLVSSDMPHLKNSARAHYYYASELNLKLTEEGWNSQMEREMIHHYERSMVISDSIYYGRLELASYYLAHKEPQKGIPVLEEMTRLFPQTSDPHFYLGQSLVQTEQYSKAIPHLEKCIELAPRSHDAYYLLAIAYAKTGRIEKGLTLAQEGLEKFPDAAGNMYEAMGHLYFEKGDMPASTNATLQMINYGRNPYDVYATIIGRYQVKGDDQNAMRFYQEAIQKGIMSPNGQ